LGKGGGVGEGVGGCALGRSGGWVLGKGECWGGGGAIVGAQGKLLGWLKDFRATCYYPPPPRQVSVMLLNMLIAMMYVLWAVHVLCIWLGAVGSRAVQAVQCGARVASGVADVCVGHGPIPVHLRPLGSMCPCPCVHTTHHTPTPRGTYKG
jgi:hypothetical protein